MERAAVQTPIPLTQGARANGKRGRKEVEINHAVYQKRCIIFVFMPKTIYLCRKTKIMAVRNFTSREFRSRQAHVFDLADQGEKVIIRRNKKQAYILVPVEDDDLTITPELSARIEKARQEIRAERCVTLKNSEDIDAYFDGL